VKRNNNRETQTTMTIAAVKMVSEVRHERPMTTTATASDPEPPPTVDTASPTQHSRHCQCQ